VKRVVATEVGRSKAGGLPKDSKASSRGEGEHASNGLAHSDLSQAAERRFSFLSDTPQHDYSAELTEITEFTATADNCRQEPAAGQNSNRLKEGTADSDGNDWNSTRRDYDSDRCYDAVTES
jgi:hypothetical protein